MRAHEVDLVPHAVVDAFEHPLIAWRSGGAGLLEVGALLVADVDPLPAVLGFGGILRQTGKQGGRVKPVPERFVGDDAPVGVEIEMSDGHVRGVLVLLASARCGHPAAGASDDTPASIVVGADNPDRPVVLIGEQAILVFEVAGAVVFQLLPHAESITGHLVQSRGPASRGKRSKYTNHRRQYIGSVEPFHNVRLLLSEPKEFHSRSYL